jgi:hypothetical protein
MIKIKKKGKWKRCGKHTNYAHTITRRRTGRALYHGLLKKLNDVRGAGAQPAVGKGL